VGVADCVVALAMLVAPRDAAIGARLLAGAEAVRRQAGAGMTPDGQAVLDDVLTALGPAREDLPQDDVPLQDEADVVALATDVARMLAGAESSEPGEDEGVVEGVRSDGVARG
jgi:hypothetical protein